jgi:hypothetical protein
MTTVSLLTPHALQCEEEFLLPEGFGLASIEQTATSQYI